jgi:stage II sporulation protein D
MPSTQLLIDRSILAACWRECVTATLCVAIVLATTTLKRPTPNMGAKLPSALTGNESTQDEIDGALQAAATDALGQHDGAIIVMDAQTGRLRAVVNQQIAFERSFAPGSTIKPFVALTALRSGLIDGNSRTLCRAHYSRKDLATVCSHPRNLPPLNVTEAIAYSCNYYFATLGERLDETSLSETLASFGLGQPTGVNHDNESSGSLRHGKRDPRNTLGEGDYLQATPIQLITAYAALVNGGRLLTPRIASDSDFKSTPRAQLQIAPEHRSLLIAGMRGAVRYGTAAGAGLNSSSFFIFGKTGTSTQTDDFHTHGWFVGFASRQSDETVPPPERIELAVLVLVQHSHGAEAAAIAQPIFEAYERSSGRERQRKVDTANVETKTLDLPVSASPILPVSLASSPLPNRIHVHLVHDDMTKEMSLEEYVLGVVAAEGSMEDQTEALKALAVAARTYAVKNLGRHAHDGFDFCTTTHCQRFLLPNQTSSDKRGRARPPNGRAADAVRATADEVLRDDAGQLVDSYFSASCGGHTANLQTLWNANAPAYLQGIPDEYCATGPHSSWTDVISTTRLQRALRTDVRTDVGARLNNILVRRRDATGRAELIEIDGERQRMVSGWDFKLIVGRALGWNRLKSSRFEIARSGSDFIFRGSGFGHGLGLCQEGAHAMAKRGASYQQILAKYFPGTNVNRESVSGSRDLTKHPEVCIVLPNDLDFVWRLSHDT